LSISLLVRDTGGLTASVTVDYDATVENELGLKFVFIPGND